MEYKRLTIKDKYGNGQIWEDDYSHPSEALQVAIDRLADLEDKIEKGTLIELPCKVGDTVYWVWEEYTVRKRYLSIYEWKVDRFELREKEWSVRGVGEQLQDGSYEFFWCHSSKFGIWWFLTREEAEKKLKELQE